MHAALHSADGFCCAPQACTACWHVWDMLYTPVLPRPALPCVFISGDSGSDMDEADKPPSAADVALSAALSAVERVPLDMRVLQVGLSKCARHVGCVGAAGYLTICMPACMHVYGHLWVQAGVVEPLPGQHGISCISYAGDFELIIHGCLFVK